MLLLKNHIITSQKREDISNYNLIQLTVLAVLVQKKKWH
jgi:hypothetical protein